MTRQSRSAYTALKWEKMLCFETRNAFRVTDWVHKQLTVPDIGAGDRTEQNL